MNAPDVAVAFTPGMACEGGFFAGRIRIDERIFGLVIAPRAEGEHAPSTWSKSRSALATAKSFYDGHANTTAMAEAGSALAKWARALRIAGHDDWYIPSRDELELAYRNLKPGTYASYAWSGDNPSTVPVGYAYDPAVHQQTASETFRSGGPEAFSEEWYWSSTQYAGYAEYAWSQRFATGTQYRTDENLKLRARAVRRFPL